MAKVTGIDRRRDIGLLILIGAMGVVAAGYPTYIAHPITILAPVPLLVALLLLDDGQLTAPIWIAAVAVTMTWSVLLYLAMAGTTPGLVYSFAMYAPFAALAFRIGRTQIVVLLFAVLTTALISARVVGSWLHSGAVWLPWKVYEGNDLAPRLVMLLPLVLISWLSVPPARRWLRSVLLVLFGAGLLSVALAQQRAGIGVVAVLLVVGLARTNWKALVAAGVAMLVVGMVFSQSIIVVLERIRIVNFKPSNATRPEIWSVAVDASRGSSWLGVGPGNSAAALREVGGGHAHNGLVQALLEAGLPGALLFIGLATYLIVLAARLLRQGGQDTLWALSLLASLGFSVVSAPLQRPDFTLVLVLVILAAREHVHRRGQLCVA